MCINCATTQTWDVNLHRWLAGEPQHGGSGTLPPPAAPRDTNRNDGIRARIAALPARMRRGAPLSPQDSAALQAVFQATNLAHVQVTCAFV